MGLAVSIMRHFSRGIYKYNITPQEKEMIFNELGENKKLEVFSS